MSETNDSGVIEQGSKELADADATLDFGRALGNILWAGDLVIMAGDLGAGKTTTTRGIGEALGVRGDVTSPTFIIAREHPSLGDGPALVHVDAYRLGGLDDLDDLDLDASLADAVTVVEWGSGMAEGLAPNRLHLTLSSIEDDGVDRRRAEVVTVGKRWTNVDVVSALGLDERPGNWR